MKKLLLLALLCLPLLSVAQNKVAEYKASNGVTYHVGDTIKLARGSAPNGDFLYVQIGGWMISSDPEQNRIKRTFSGFNMIVKKMKLTKWRGAEKMIFTTGGGTLTNYNVFIEDAIATCEILPCKDANAVAATAPKADDNLDKLKKLKSLLDSGAITQAEYDEKKKKLLEAL